MDKYQEFLMKNISYKCGNRAGSDKKILSESALEIVQNEDITVTQYPFDVVSDCICTIYSVKNQERTEEWSKGGDGRTFSCIVDFDDRIDGLKISFKDNVADDLYIPVIFVEADKDAYYAKLREQKRAEYISKATISNAEGVNLVNIYFQPCDKSYEKTEVELYLYKNHQLLARYSVSGEQFYLAVPNLARNNYEYIVKQYDKKGELLFETERVSFFIHNNTNLRF